MRSHLQRDLESLTKKLLLVGAMVEDATQKALLALTDRRLDLAREVEEGDVHIDAKEVEVEEDCLKVLALHAPVAADLRLVIAYLKLNNDLERVGDLAQNLAQRAAFLSTRESIEIPAEIGEMGARVQNMLRKSLDAVVNGDTEQARWVLTEDEEVDAGHKAVYRYVEQRIGERPEHVEEILQLLSVSRYLERMADQATNIAEDVVFMVEGEVIRHQVAEIR